MMSVSTCLPSTRNDQEYSEAFEASSTTTSRALFFTATLLCVCADCVRHVVSKSVAGIFLPLLPSRRTPTVLPAYILHTIAATSLCFVGYLALDSSLENKLHQLKRGLLLLAFSLFTLLSYGDVQLVCTIARLPSF